MYFFLRFGFNFNESGQNPSTFPDGSKRIFGMVHELELDVTSGATNNLEEVDYLIFPI